MDGADGGGVHADQELVAIVSVSQRRLAIPGRAAFGSEPRVKAGHVYILSHPAWKLGFGTDKRSFVKIGKTRGTPNGRALKIASASGLLAPPRVEWAAWVADMGAVEQAVHRHFRHVRVHKRREMFFCTPTEARGVIEAVSGRVGSTPMMGLRGPQPVWGHRRAPLSRWLVLAAAGASIMLMMGLR